MFPVAVSSLVQVHKVHIDFFIWDFAIILSGKVAIRFLQVNEAIDPHFAWAESVAPCDNASAVRVIVGFTYNISNFFISFCGDLVYQFARQVARSI